MSLTCSTLGHPTRNALDCSARGPVRDGAHYGVLDQAAISSSCQDLPARVMEDEGLRSNVSPQGES